MTTPHRTGDHDDASLLGSADGAYQTGDYARAARLYEAARSAVSTPSHQAFIDLNVAQCRRAQGLAAEAIEVVSSGLARSRTSPDLRGRLLVTLGNALGDQAKHHHALDAFCAAEECFAAVGYQDGAAQCAVSRSRSLIATGETNRARAELTRLVEDESISPFVMSQALNNLALLEWSEGSLVVAKRLFQHDLQLAGASDDHWGVSATLLNLAQLELESGEADEARVLASSARNRAIAGGSAELESRAIRFLNQIQAERPSDWKI